MAMDTGRRTNGALSEINVTPLVDVMLVLLVIFMVTAPLVTQGVEVRLPQAGAAPLPERQEPVVVSVNRERRVFINESEIRSGRLVPTVQGILKNRGAETDVYLRADRDVPYGVVMQTMAELKRAGVARLGMVTEPEESR